MLLILILAIFSGNGTGGFIAKSAHFASQSHATPQSPAANRAVEQVSSSFCLKLGSTHFVGAS